MLREHGFAAAGAAVVLLVCGWLATDTTWRLLRPEVSGEFYDAQSESLLAGRLDVPCASIGAEAWLSDGKCFGYFGPTPALGRLGLNAIWPELRGRWSSVSVLAALALSLLCAWHLLRESRRRLGGGGGGIVDGLFLIAVGLGSTAVLLASPPFIYNEASAWGAALALLTYCAVLRFLTTRRLAPLLFATGAAALAIHARPTVGLGATLAALGATGAVLCESVWQRDPTRLGARIVGSFLPAASQPGARRSALLATGFLLVGIGLSPGALLYGKFGTFGLPSLDHHIQISRDPARFARTGGSFVQPGNLPYNAAHYLTPWDFRFDRTFPWFEIRKPPLDFPLRPRIDWVGEVVALPITSPALCVLTGVGVVALIRRRELAAFRGLVLAAAVSSGPVLVIAWLIQRYLHDFFPLLVVAGAVGASALAVLRPGPRRSVCVAGLALLVLVSVHVSGSFALAHHAARGEVRDALLGLRLLLHDRPDEVVLEGEPAGRYPAGIHDGPSPRRFILERGRGFLPQVGQRLAFAGSGERRIVGVQALPRYFVVTVDGALDPGRDGHPHPVRLLGAD